MKWDDPALEDRLTLNEVSLTLPVPFGQKTHHFIKDFIKDQGIQLTERQEEILQMVRVDETITSQKISRKNTAAQRTIIKDMNILQEYGLLTRIGGKKDGHWESILSSDVIES